MLGLYFTSPLVFLKDSSKLQDYHFLWLLRYIMYSKILFNMSPFCFPDCETHVAFYLPVHREVVSRNDRASGAGSKHPPEYLQFYEGRCGGTGEFLLWMPAVHGGGLLWKHDSMFNFLRVCSGTVCLAQGLRSVCSCGSGSCPHWAGSAVPDGRAVTLPTDLLANAVFMTGFPIRVHFTVFLQDPFSSVRIEFLRNDHKQSVLLWVRIASHWQQTEWIHPSEDV